MTKEKDRWYQELVESEGELMDLTSAHERLQEKLQKKQGKSRVLLRGIGLCQLEEGICFFYGLTL